MKRSQNSTKDQRYTILLPTTYCFISFIEFIYKGISTKCTFVVPVQCTVYTYKHKYLVRSKEIILIAYTKSPCEYVCVKWFTLFYCHRENGTEIASAKK